MTTDTTGVAEDLAFVAFGSSAIGAAAADTIDLSTQPNLAFSIPREGVITGLSATISIATDFTGGGNTVRIYANLYLSDDTNSNVFQRLEDTQLMLAESEEFTAGTVYNSTLSDLEIIVPAGSRLLLVFSIEGTAQEEAQLGVYASAGLTIA